MANINERIYDIFIKIQFLIKRSSALIIQPSYAILQDLFSKLLRPFNLIKFILLGFESILFIINSQTIEKNFQEKDLIPFLELFENSINYAEFTNDYIGTMSHFSFHNESIKNSWVNYIERPKEFKLAFKESLQIIEVNFE